MTVGVVDYGMGNINSLISLFKKSSLTCCITSDEKKLDECDLIMLPGVGAFEAAMKKLEELRLISYLQNSKKPIVGICLGMQLLFEYGEEGLNTVKGLGVINGSVKKLSLMKLPNVGFSQIIQSDISMNLLGKDYYFIHSYGAERKDNCAKYASICVNSQLITAAVQKNNFIGFQFHPELSQNNGLMLFNEIVQWLKSV